MIGRDLGGYRILSRLGSGAMGSVYLAQRDGERVAIKVLHPHLIEKPGYFKRFQREILAGCRVDHRNVVRTLDGDLAKVDGEPVCYLVMEYVEGRSLRALLQDVGPLPDGLLRDLAAQLGAGLAAIHAQDIVHRDLKPDNIFVTTDEIVKIMDLGLVRLDVGPRISTTDQFIGSVRYAAPEQIRGEDRPLDGRTDLFALGVILYELATGRHPFAGELPRQFLDDLMAADPEPVRRIRPGASPFVAEIIHRLLAKDRANRFPSAAELLDVLRAGEGSQWWMQRPAPVPLRTFHRPTVPHETPVFGRDDELARLRAEFERARSGEGRVVLVEGAAGVGKTRLLDELLARLEADAVDVDVFFGSYPPGGAATALHAFTRAFRGRFDGDSLDAEIARRLAAAPALAAPFAAVLRGEPAGEQLSRDSIQTAFTHLLRSFAQERPTILVVDDLHFAPGDGLAVFLALALAVPDHRVLMIGTTRHRLAESWQGEIERFDHVNPLGLSPLSSEAIEFLVAEALSSESVVADLGSIVATKSDGNPLFALEILRDLKDSRLLVPREGGGWTASSRIGEITVPTTVAHLLKARLADLDEEGRNLLELGACCGFEFDPLLLADAQGVSPIPMLRSLYRIERHTGLIRSVGSVFAFDHHLIQETLCAGLPESLRKAYHGLLADTLERGASVGAADIRGALAADLCDHQFRAGRPERALPYLTAGLDHLEAAYHNERAIDMARRGLGTANLVTGGERIDLLQRVAGLLELTARMDEAMALEEEAHELADTLGDARRRVTVRTARGSHLRAVGKLEEARKILEEGVELSRETGDDGDRAGALTQLGNCMDDLGRPEEAGRLLEDALAIATETGEARPVISATAALGQLRWAAGELAEARRHFERAMTMAREIPDRRTEAILTGMLGLVHDDLGDHEKAAEHHRRHQAIARDIGYRHGEEHAASNLGDSLRGLGRLEEARRLFRKAGRLCAEMGDRLGIADSLVNRGLVECQLGRNDEARDTIGNGLREARKLGSRRTEVLGLHWLARVETQSGQPERAEPLIAEALALGRESGLTTIVADALVLHGSILLRLERPDEAARRFDLDARENCQGSARENRTSPSSPSCPQFLRASPSLSPSRIV